MTQVSRRHLLAGAAGAAAVYGAATAHAATTSDLNICAAPKFDESFDLVVIGSGGAGLSSAVMAKQQGVKRILVWKRWHSSAETLPSPAAASTVTIRPDSKLRASRTLLNYISKTPMMVGTDVPIRNSFTL